MTKEEIKRNLRNKKRRERYLLVKDERNKLRREKYAVAVESGLNYKQARDFRGYGSETIVKKYKSIKYLRKGAGYIYKYYAPIKEIDYKEVELPISKKVSKRTERRRLARSLGYTPDEADYLRDVAESKWKTIIDNKVIIDSQGRADRWCSMSSRDKYDKSIVDACEKINIDNGYDINSRYGWAVYYFWYLHGGEIEDWLDYVLPDAFYADMLQYEGSPSTFLLNKGYKRDKGKFIKYERGFVRKRRKVKESLDKKKIQKKKKKK